MMGRKILGIEWAPLHVPLERRLQTLAMAIYAYVFMISWTHAALILIFLLFTPFFWIPLLYGTWMLFTWNMSTHGGWKLAALRNNAFNRRVRDYFPMSLVKTADLDPTQRYIFGYHPHGVMCSGVFNLTTDTTGFSDKFPGISVHHLTLKFLHFLPGLREFFMFNGCGDVSKESIDYILDKTGSGAAVNIVIGGAREGLDARPHTVTLVLKDRMGFAKMALKHGAHLVPCFTFGENELFWPVVDNRPGTRARRLQDFLQKKFAGFTLFLVSGRGLFNYSFGLLPNRVPITTVVGRPIIVEKDEAPTRDKIVALHSRYMDELLALFEEHKQRYGYGDKTIDFIK